MDAAQRQSTVSDSNRNDLLLKTVQALSVLREVIVKGLESGIRNDASDAAIAMRQKVRKLSKSLTQNILVGI